MNFSLEYIGIAFAGAGIAILSLSTILGRRADIDRARALSVKAEETKLLDIELCEQGIPVTVYNLKPCAKCGPWRRHEY